MNLPENISSNLMRQALSHDCFDCNAKAGESCTYMPLKDAYGENVTKAQGRTRIPYVERTGRPTARPHNARLKAVWYPGWLEKELQLRAHIAVGVEKRRVDTAKMVEFMSRFGHIFEVA